MANFKEREAVLHDCLHNNISLLTLAYPTTVLFQDKFKHGMFKKNNQPGSQEVLYYLLSIILGEDIRKHITVFPLCEIRQESKFRMEILKCITHLQEKYADCGVPKLQTSHLITPAGYKYVKFLIKLSDLAMFVHLSKNTDHSLLCRMKSSNSVIVKTAKLKLKIFNENINGGNKEIYNEYTSSKEMYDREVELINNKLQEVKSSIYKLTENGLPPKKTFSALRLKEYNNSSDKTTYENWLLTELQQRLSSINSYSDMSVICSELTNYLLSNDSILEYTKSLTNIPQELEHIMNNENGLDLVLFFESFLIYLQKQFNKEVTLPESFLTRDSIVLETTNKKYLLIVKDIENVISKLKEATIELNQCKLNNLHNK